MWEEYAKARGLSVTSLTQAQKVEAEYLGILQETELQVGDLAKASDTLMGAQAEQQAQMTKLATSFGDAMAPSVQAVTEAGTEFLETMTGIVSEFPALTSGATGAAAAFTALVAAMKGLEALKALMGALSIGSATLGPLAAVAAVIGVVVAAYSALTNAQEEAKKAEEEAQKEKETLRTQELNRLRDVNRELSELKTQYAGSETSMASLAGAYDSGNDAIVDRIRLLEEEQAALLEKQKVEAEIALAEKQAQLDRWQSAAEGLAGDITGDRDIFKYTSAWTDAAGAGGDWTSLWQQGLEDWILTLETRVPEATELAYQLRDALYNAENMEEAQGKYEEFMTGLMEQIATTSDEASELEEFIAAITEAMENPEAFDFDKTFDGAKNGAKEAAEGTDDLSDAVKAAQDQYNKLDKDITKVTKELKDTKALKDQVSGYKDIVKETKNAGKSWDDLSDDVKKFGRQLGVADGDIDGLESALETLEGTLDSSMADGASQAQYLILQLSALRAMILSIPEAQLTGDASDLLAAIAEAIAELEELLAMMAEAGIDIPTGSTGGGGGGGGGGKKSDSGGGKSPEEIYREMYDEEIELIEHKRHMEQITLQEEIRMLEKVKREYAEAADMVMDIDERIYDARKELREQEQDKITSLYDAILEALEERYEEQREAEQKRIDESIEAWEKWADESTAAIQKQIDALDEAEEAAERAEEEQKHLDKIAKLEASLPFETDEYNRSQIERQIEKAREELQKLYDEWAKEDYRQSLEEQMDAIEQKAEEEIEKLEEESERIDTVYDKLTEGASLAAEAQKILMDGNQKEILDLISSYAPDYEATGRSLGEKLFNGFKKAFGDITKYFEGIDKQFEDMVEKINNTAFGETQKIQSEGQGTANISNPTVNQTVNFNQPVESPAEVAERMQQVSEDLAAMI